MREIKFRAWKHNSKKMYFVTNMIWKEDWIGVNSTDSIGINYVDNHCPNEYELMQFTGLTDKNGVEIYEGDILAYRDGEWSYDAIVTWGDWGWYMVGIEHNDNYIFEDIDADSHEIIGNIYDNPELLRGTDNE
jgi:uncharacterized phage protein (TIGR01671 family)